MRIAYIWSAAFVGLALLTNGTFAQVNAPEDRLLPIALKCPSGSDKTIELTSANQVRTTQRMRVSFANDQTPLIVTLDFAPPGKPFQPLRQIDLRTKIDPNERTIGEYLAKQASDLLVKVCLGSEQSKSDHAALLMANRAKLGMP